MNSRERFYNVTHYKSFDRVFNREFGYWNETLLEWHKAGLPKDVDNNEKADVFFKFDIIEGAGVHVGLQPPFEEKVLYEDKDYKIVIDGEGVKKKIFKDGTSSIPHFVDFSLKDRESWKEFKKRLQPNPNRYPKDWEERKKEWKNRDYPLAIGCGSLLGWVRDWMGFENYAMAFYDDPVLMEEIMETLSNLIVTTIEKALKEVQFDLATFWEDIAFNHGPIISPEMFKKFAVPNYKRITNLLRKYNVDVVWVDCDGNINDLVGLWLSAGVNGMFPIEVHAGTDPVKLREKYGKDVLLFGGVNKRELIKGKREIDNELKRIAHLVEEGGYVPHVDHRCPPDVSYENYLYYLKKKKEIFNIKDWDIESIEKTLIR